MAVGRTFCLENFADKYQKRLVATEIQCEHNLRTKFKQLDKKLSRDVKSLRWKFRGCLPENTQPYSNIYKADLVPDFKNRGDMQLFTPIDRKKPISGIKITNYKFSKYLPRTPTNELEEEQKKPFCEKTYHDKIKFTQECLKAAKIMEKYNHPETIRECGIQPHTMFYDSSTFEKMETIKEDFKILDLRMKKELFPKIVYPEELDTMKKTPVKENRVIYAVEENPSEQLEEHIKLFQRLLRGRAYQIMMFMAKIRYMTFLEAENLPGAKVKQIDLEIENDYEQEITTDNVLALSITKGVGRFLNTLHHESVMTNGEVVNMYMNEHEDGIRLTREAAEANKRKLEETARNEQNEILKQALKIHQETSILFSERLIQQTIGQCAEQDGRNLIRMLTATKAYWKNNYYDHKKKNVDMDLIHNFLVPEASKIIHREQQNDY